MNEVIKNALTNKLESLNQRKWHRVFEKNASLEAKITIEDIVDKYSHNYLVTTKLEQKHTRRLLFVINPTGPTNFESSRLRETYGKPVLNNTSRSLRVPIFADKDTLFNNEYLFRIIIDRKQEKIFIRISNKNGKLLEQKVYWTFESLKNIIDKKVKKIVEVKYLENFNGIDEYYNIESLKVYDQVNFEKFLHELEIGNIRIYLKVAVYLSGIYIGKTHDHGATFHIINKRLPLLFDTYEIKKEK